MSSSQQTGDQTGSLQATAGATAVATSALDHGRACYQRRAWADAFQALSEANRITPLAPGDLQLLALSAALSGNDEDFLGLWSVCTAFTSRRAARGFRRGRSCRPRRQCPRPGAAAGAGIVAPGPGQTKAAAASAIRRVVGWPLDTLARTRFLPAAGGYCPRRRGCRRSRSRPRRAGGDGGGAEVAGAGRHRRASPGHRRAVRG